MSMWRSSQSWQPKQFGWSHPAEWPPFVAWLAPASLGLLGMIAGGSPDGTSPELPTRVGQLGLFGDYWISTLLYSPLWGFPAILAAFPLRAMLINSGLFGRGRSRVLPSRLCSAWDCCWMGCSTAPPTLACSI